MCTPSAGPILALANVASTLTAMKAQGLQTAYAAQALAQQAQQQLKVDQATIELRRAQSSDNITLEQVRRFSQGLRERGIMSARLADAGVAGGSTLRDAVTSVIQEETDVGTIERRKQIQDAQLIMERRGAEVRAESQLNKAQDIYRSGKTPTGAGVLQLLAAGVSGYATGKQLEPMKR